MAAVISACTNDDNEPGIEISGNDGTNNKLPNGDDIWPENVRRVRRVERIDESGLPEDRLFLLYHGNVITNEADAEFYCLELEDSVVEIQTGDGTSRTELKDGKIMKAMGNIRARDYTYDSCYCTYGDGYLKQMTILEFAKWSDDKDKILYDFTFNSENLYSIKIVSDEETEELKYSYAENATIRNDASIDWNVLMTSLRDNHQERGDFNGLGLFGFFGKRTKSLPNKVVYAKNSTYEQIEEEWSISYKVDAEGYPVQIKCEEKDGEKKVRTVGIYYY